MRTSFHHQPEAQHPKSPAIETPPGRLPHLLRVRRTCRAGATTSGFDPKRTWDCPFKQSIPTLIWFRTMAAARLFRTPANSGLTADSADVSA
jgi:hypothetical protein